MDIFKNNELDYLAWHEAHPEGYVFNHFGGTNPAYNVLHHSTCSFLWREKDEGARTAVEKWCSSVEQDLTEHCDTTLGHGMWNRCSHCFGASKVN